MTCTATLPLEKKQIKTIIVKTTAVMTTDRFTRKKEKRTNTERKAVYVSQLQSLTAIIMTD